VDFVTTLGIARSERLPARRPPRFRTAWPAATLALFAMFVTQESLEGALFGGHMAGMHGLFGHMGWTAVLLAPLFGALIAFLVKGSEKVIEFVSRNRARRPRPARACVVPARPPVVPVPRVPPLACNLAGRAPPHPAS
jgi:hypothetical protein